MPRRMRRLGTTSLSSIGHAKQKHSLPDFVKTSPQIPKTFSGLTQKSVADQLYVPTNAWFRFCWRSCGESRLFAGNAV